MEYIKFFKTFLSKPIEEGETNHNDDCPFCGKKNKFYANVKTGLWDCKVCDLRGNAEQFITEYHSMYLSQTTDEDYARLAKERKIPASVFETARLAYNSDKDQWLVPYFSPFKHIINLGYFTPSYSYRIYKCLPLMPYIPVKRKAKDWKKFLPEEVAAVEGEWDTWAWMALSDIPAVGMPGAGTFKEDYLKVFSPVKKVWLVYDDDAAGQKGLAKAADKLSSREIMAIDWSLLPSSAEKRDVRQLIIDHKRKKAAELINSAFLPYTAAASPDEPKLGSGYHSDVTAFDQIDSWSAYINEYRNILYVNDETERAMKAMTAVVLTNHIEGEPLWAFCVGQPSSGKTTYLESYGGRNQLFDFVSKLSAKALVSGWRREDGKEASLLPQINNKVLIVKDFTTVLAEPKDKQGELFAILRDAYDGVIKIPYGNGRVEEHHGIKFNMIAGVTDAIHSHNDSEFGERWFKIDFLGQNYNEMKYIRAAFAKLGRTKVKKEALTSLTLGFLASRLRKILDTKADTLFDGVPLSETDIDTGFNVPEEWVDRLASLGRFVARVSAKPRNDRYEGIVYRPRYAMPTRISLQLAKLWKGVTWTLDTDFNEESFDIVRKVTYDTCYGFTFEVVNYLAQNPGATRKGLQEGLGLPSTRVHRIIADLRALKLVKTGKANNGSGNRGRDKDKLYLDDKMGSIYDMIQPPEE